MKHKRYSEDALIQLFQRNSPVADLHEIKIVLGSRSTMTVFRKLKPLSYFTSYSHNGIYYSLERYMSFDENGVCSFGQIHFSKFGTLMQTCAILVNNSISGCTISELEKTVHVTCRETLLRLYKRGNVSRQKLDRSWLYCHADMTIAERQRRNREQKRLNWPSNQWLTEEVGINLKDAIIRFSKTLDEKQKRLYAGLESAKLGHGGDRKMSSLLGLHVQTVAKGRQEAISGDFVVERVRKIGGGRKLSEKKRQR